MIEHTTGWWVVYWIMRVAIYLAIFWIAWCWATASARKGPFRFCEHARERGECPRERCMEASGGRQPGYNPSPLPGHSRPTPTPRPPPPKKARPHLCTVCGMKHYVLCDDPERG